MNHSKLQEALQRIDAANQEDPNREDWQGQRYPKELLYSQRMSAWLERLEPNAADALRIAARAQHIRRWSIPRNDYPQTRDGYLKWRTRLYDFHARETAHIMQQVGYDEASIEQVRKILMKKGMKKDPAVQLIEDIACLVFIDSYLLDFVSQHDEAKLISIVQKTWKKMSERARREALKLDLPEAAQALIGKALA